MTPTKASLAKSYPHLVPKSPARGQRVTSPIRQPPRRSVAPDGLTEVVEVNRSTGPGRRFADIANDTDEEVRDEQVTGPKRDKRIVSEVHLSREEEIERRKGVLMRRVRILRAECEGLEVQVEQARQTRQSALDSQEKALGNIDAIMYLLPTRH